MASGVLGSPCLAHAGTFNGEMGSEGTITGRTNLHEAMARMLVYQEKEKFLEVLVINEYPLESKVGELCFLPSLSWCSE